MVNETEGRTAHASTEGTSICCHGTEGGRNLVVNLDGTGNQFGDKNTNVVELYNLLHKDKNQLSLYDSGIGTYARPSWTSFSYYKEVIYHKIDLAIAWQFEKRITGAYSWLSDNYEDGDRIFLIGFSRGAYQVRALSAMIDKVGLLHKGNSAQVPFAYELYADPLSGVDQINAVGTSDRDGDARRSSKAERFKSAFCHKDVKVHFVGAWDTVSSIGIFRKKKLLPGTIDGMKHVCFFRHALALDERRVKFLPEYAYGETTLPPGHTDPALPPASDADHPTIWSRLCALLFCAIICIFAPCFALPIWLSLIFMALYLLVKLCTKFFFSGSGDDESTSDDDADNTSKPQCLEVWFAGTHSDIGGGNVQNVGMDKSGPPLRWMVHEADALGLRMKPFSRELSSNEHIEVIESLTGLWKVLEWLPFRRLTFNGETEGGSETYIPHLSAGRVIQPGQRIHASLMLAIKPSKFEPDGYIPKARLSTTVLSNISSYKRTIKTDKDFWENLQVHKRFRYLIEVDLEQHVKMTGSSRFGNRDPRKQARIYFFNYELKYKRSNYIIRYQ
ncbi:hypothetical protein D9613_011583 [Agrocybe pediades]|uniref:T6SS Phospholipase effector Tle1-like catalytic domain-containing protein n=1 Tax=Agrocybe pediades TaxID=84607 RepID=A0A8H4QVU0_9AGAR|nr:hypothetical protein D9613_011583 [Agrocybe pediades]